MLLEWGSRGAEVAALQRQLAARGYVSGIFDSGTDSALRVYQSESGLGVDGKAGNESQAALVADTQERGGASSFLGSYGLLIGCEGYEAFPYKPAGEGAGVTCGFGWDLRWQTADAVRRIFSGFWTPALLGELCGAVGLAGEDARRWLLAHPPKRWPISAVAAGRVLPACAAPYWAKAVAECPELVAMPPRVQTVVMSATYSMWTAPIRAMRDALRQSDWLAAAAALERQGGSPERRAREAALLRTLAS